MTFTQVRNSVVGFLYRYLLKPIFFWQDPEKVHDRMLIFGRVLGSHSLTRKLVGLAFGFKHPGLEQNIAGMRFLNPIGLAAGFDKDACLTDILPAVGFGFAEVGSITGQPYAGNLKPRLWRLKQSRGLVVYYGLKNDGCEAVAKKLAGKHFNYPLGISVAKTNSRAAAFVQDGIADYLKTFRRFAGIGDYFTINISCPNSWEEEEPFTTAENLDQLLTELEKLPTRRPVFIKLSPDLPRDKLDSILAVADRHNITGFVCGNLTKKRDNPKIVDKDVPLRGGFSGKVVEELADRLIRYVYRKTRGRYVIIGCGGVFSAEDAYKKIRLGASLIQLITGMIFEGPQLISEINAGLVRLLAKDGYAQVSQAVGSGNQI